jgi:hypothetical protein
MIGALPKSAGQSADSGTLAIARWPALNGAASYCTSEVKE